jgi:hypothetical protein
MPRAVKNQRLTQVAELLQRDHPDGLTVPEIAAKLGCNPTSARRACKASPNIYIDRWQPTPFRNRKTSNAQVQLTPVWCWTDYPLEDAPALERTYKKDDIIAALEASPDGLTVAELRAMFDATTNLVWSALRSDPRVVIDRWVAQPPSRTSRRPRYYWAAVVAVSTDPEPKDAPKPERKPSREYTS